MGTRNKSIVVTLAAGTLALGAAFTVAADGSWREFALAAQESTPLSALSAAFFNPNFTAIL